MKITRVLLATAITALIGFAACSPKDEDIKTAIEKKLKAEPGISSTLVDVKNGIATIEGQCKDDTCKANCEKISQEVKGVKTVISNLTVAPPPVATVINPVAAPVSTADSVAGTNEPEDPLTKSLAGVTKNFPTVKASAKDGIVTITGEIKKTDLPKLMKALSALKPKKIVKKLTVVKPLKKKHSKPKKRSRRK
ncbi:MAG: BON domain-containing protein [Ferruginibacter sp.]